MPTRDYSRKHVRFQDDFAPSSITIRLKLGPKDRPTAIVKISVYFEEGRLPRIKVKTKRPNDRTRSRDL